MDDRRHVTGAAPPEVVGLFTGFEGYLTPSDDDYRGVLTSGLVVLDTNVLLNLYRYNSSARSELIDLFNQLADRLWLPHQVLAEFWRNRESTLDDAQKRPESTVQKLEEHLERTQETLREWARRTALSDENAEELTKPLIDEFERLKSKVTGPSASEDVLSRETQTDPVIASLEPLVRGRVGPPLDDAAYEEAVSEGKRRVDAEEPPGYADREKAKKPAKEGAAGDYIVWEQVLCEAESRRCDVLLVTDDLKEDWWRFERGERRGPRPELADELRRRAGVRLFMLTPASLLRKASSILDVQVSDASLSEVERVDRQALTTLEDALARPTPNTSGWTRESIQSLLSALDEEDALRSRVIRLAAQSGGFVDRDAIYKLAGYDPAVRSLRAFTRPVRRITQGLKDRGVVPEDAIDVLSARYDSYGGTLAVGFEIPNELVSLILDTRVGRGDQ